MANDVFANGREVSCKKADGKSICAFPDVCFTPPQTPATPPGVPIPYPNTGFAKDTKKGSKSVKITKKEVMLKNKSYFKKSTGDEAGCASKKGVITSTNKGKVYFTSWSMDVKFEGKNVVRHLDLTTHNHRSMPGNSPPWPYIDSIAIDSEGNSDDPCKDEKENEKAACSKSEDGDYMSAEDCCKDDDCQKARNCMLVPYGGSGSPNCCDGKTGHHLLPNSLLQTKRGDSSTNVVGLKKTGDNAYTVNKGACVCVDGASHSQGDHGELHDKTKEKLRSILESGEELTYDKAKEKAAEAHAETFLDDDGKHQCNQACLEAQIDASLNKSKTGSEIKVRQKDGMTRKNFDKSKNKGAKK
jgi:hypothetical protein